MGLTRKSVGKDAVYNIADTVKTKSNQKVIALIGNPNVGKSTLFNTITGMHQHTGNWPGKTVKSAIGKCLYNDTEYIFVDLPGCYSLKARSPEEEVSRDFICSGKADAVVVVCDATALERNLNLVLQIKEMTDDVIVCVNLMDEAKKKHISLDLKKLEKELSTKVLGTTAHKKKFMTPLLSAIEEVCFGAKKNTPSPLLIYPDYIENMMQTVFAECYFESPTRADALSYIESKCELPWVRKLLNNKTQNDFNDDVVNTINKKAEEIADSVIVAKKEYKNSLDIKIDKILTGKFFGFLGMFILFLLIFWITITGANYPSEFLSNFFTSLEEHIYNGMRFIRIPAIICDMTVYGVYHILTWIIAVMLPPMAIFFPLFTFLEDVGYLPRIAFNLDKCFKKCSACGKQALTMCMGFGCNAAGVVGCRIIDSKRERLLAIITNTFVPCNGRFPAIISVITMFFLAENVGVLNSFFSAIILALFIVLGIFVTFFVSKILSKTLLKGMPSAFTLELPPYRKPQISKIIVRSIFDRTLFVLGRAVCVAAPAGLLIWLFANINIGNASILTHISGFLDPLGKLMGLDGVILTAFVFGFPANEIVVPLIMMIYASNGVLTDMSNLFELKGLLVSNGWTVITAVNTIIFMLMHWPCSTTCLTIKSETKSWKWTSISILVPTLCGVITCIGVNLISKMFI